MLKKAGKDVFSKVKNQLRQSAKDKIQLSWKHFQEGQAVSNLTKADAIKFVWLGLLKDVGHKRFTTKSETLNAKFNAKVKISIYLIAGFTTVGIFP